MTRLHSTRNTSIRTRKIRGDDSLLSSISMSERAEGPEGIACVIRSKKRLLGGQYGTARLRKKIRKPSLRPTKGELDAETGLGLEGIVETLVVHRDFA